MTTGIMQQAQREKQMHRIVLAAGAEIGPRATRDGILQMPSAISSYLSIIWNSDVPWCAAFSTEPIAGRLPKSLGVHGAVPACVRPTSDARVA